jgi:S-adenosylmethionine-diacylglycerol 3-amino-3-carboxypropyl transferase
MSQSATTRRPSQSRLLADALFRHDGLTRAALSERAFALAFSGLIYAQIWEDPEIDMEAMELAPGHRVVTIASGGCNALSYLSRSPARVEAIDLNAAHVALGRLKTAAFRHLPSYRDTLRFLGTPAEPVNVAAYDRFLRARLDESTRRYWDARDWRGRRRIAAFDRSIHRSGLLGLWIRLAHLAARLHGVDPSRILDAETVAEQRRFFEVELKPLFARPAIRWLTQRRASLFGLGIPPAQYERLMADGSATMADVLSARLEKLACHFPLADNYFAWQAFGRGYADNGPLPPCLQAAHHAAVRDGAARLTFTHTDMTSFLARKPAGSVDRFVLLDAQDWMSDAQLDALWHEIERTAAPRARVIFRTGGIRSVVEGRVAAAILDRWHYHEARSAELCARDRSAIYGGFHLYERTS